LKELGVSVIRRFEKHIAHFGLKIAQFGLKIAQFGLKIVQNRFLLNKVIAQPNV
jgi:hypothetical protein